MAAVALSGTQAVQEDAALGMNRSQLAGVATALSHRVSLLQGPPGTGAHRWSWAQTRVHVCVCAPVPAHECGHVLECTLHVYACD